MAEVYALFGKAGVMTRIDGGDALPVGTVLRLECGYGGSHASEAVVTGSENGPGGQVVTFECGRKDRVYPRNLDSPGIGFKSTGRRLTPEQVAEWVAKGEATEAERKRVEAEKELEAKAEYERGAVLYAEARPEWATHVIVAECDKDESDSMTDYFAHKTTRRVVLAWSKHGRDLFPEMRKAAAKFKETAHLGPGLGEFIVSQVFVESVPGTAYWEGSRNPWRESVTFQTQAEVDAFIAEAGEPEPISIDGHLARFSWHVSERSVEHKEKYSGGGGYYLKRGGGHWSGWRVCKRSLDGWHGDLAVAFARGDFAL